MSRQTNIETNTGFCFVDLILAEMNYVIWFWDSDTHGIPLFQLWQKPGKLGIQTHKQTICDLGKIEKINGK